MEKISKLTPILYEKNETDFNHNGLGRLRGLIVHDIEESLNGEFEAFLEYPASGDLADKIDNQMLIKLKPNRKDDATVFRIYEYDLDITTGNYIIYARHKNMDDLASNMILDLNIRQQTPSGAWNQAQSQALDPVHTQFYSDITTTSSTKWTRRSLLNCIAGEQGSMIQYWGGEIKHGTDRISLYRRRGRDNVTTVRHGKNLDGLTATYSTRGLVTAIVPYHTYRPEDSDDERTIYGDVVQSQYIENYPRTYYDTVEYNDNDLGLSEEPTEVEREERLNEVAERWFIENTDKDLPSVNMEIDLIDLSQTKEYEQFKDFEQIEIGDTVTVYSKKYNVHVNAKVRRVVYDGLTDMNKEIEVGTVTRTIYDDYQNMVDNRVQEVREQVDAVRASANGKNVNIYGTVDPNEANTSGQNGDNYFRQNGQEDEIWIFRDGMWHKVMDSADTTKNAREIEQAQQEAEEAKQQAIDSKQEAVDEAEQMVADQDAIYQELFDGYDAAVDDLTQGVVAADKKAGDALIQAGESGSLAQSASEGVVRVEHSLDVVNNKATDALSKADDAVVKANNIPQTIDGVIASKGLVSGDWVTKQINEETGEINYALESIRGDVPDVILGIEWDRTESPKLTRTDYVEEFANLNDYELQAAEFKLSVEGLGMDLAEVQRDKLDSGVFTSFKTNEYANDIDGIRQRLTSAEENKLDDSTFQSFKEHDYQVTVNGLNGSIQKLDREKLDENEFESFKSNEYQLTVDGFEMALTGVEGAIPNLVLGVEWNRTESPRMERTDYTEELDLTNYDAPDYVMGVEWDKKESPVMIRTYDTQESTSKEEFELFLSEYNFRADGWDATNTYINENSTAINSLISNAHGWSQTISYVDENQTKINETISQVDSYKQTLGSNGEKITQLVMTDESFITRVGEIEGMTEDIILGVEWDKGSDPTMARTGYMDDWTETQVAQLADSWVLNIKSGSDIKTAINATTDGIRFKGELIHIESERTLIDNAVIKSAHIDALNVSKLTGTAAEFTTLRSKIITADVIESTHIKADNALFDMLFATSAATDRLSAQTAWIKNGMFANASIDGAKIQDATIGSAKISSLDVGKISGNTTNFVQSNWNSAAGGNVRITGSGIVTTASNNSQTYIQNGIVGTRNPNGATIGQLGYINDGGSPSYTVTTSLGSHFKVKQIRSGSLRESFALLSGGYDGYINTNRFEFTGNQGVHFYNQLTLQNDLNANSYNIYGVYDVQLDHGGYLRTLSSGQTRLSSSGGALQLGVSGSWKLTMDSTYLYAQVNLSMGGNDITNQSDERLKTNILNHRESSLDKISRFNFVDFTWLKNGREDFGVIAQQVQQVAPELISEGTNGYLSVNNSLLNMMTTHAVQQLAFEHDSVAQTVDSHTDTIHTLQQELSQANRRIKELEEKIA